MSRVGKMPIDILNKVEVKIDDDRIYVKGPKGNLEYGISSHVCVDVKENKVVVSAKNDSKESSSMWGTTRTLINNMITGVSIGFNKSLLFDGVGYKAIAKGDLLTLNLGYSHQIKYNLPKGVSAKVIKNEIQLSGIDKELLGFAAAKIRSFRPPEPYKGKGIRYFDEVIIRKAGKSGGKK